MWGDIPIGRVVRIEGAPPEALELALEPLPEDSPAIVAFHPQPFESVHDAVESLINVLHEVAVSFYPTWLSGADGIGVGGAGKAALQVLARKTAAKTGEFAPFLLALAIDALRNGKTESMRLARSVRIKGLARVIARTYGRRNTALVIHPPDGMSDREASMLVAACREVANAGELGVWLILGVDSQYQDIEIARVQLEVNPNPQFALVASRTDHSYVTFPPLEGRPHPGSKAEQHLESALSRCSWAVGRVWNKKHTIHTLVNPIRIDLMFQDERCAVEVDGPDHCGALKFEADRQRDVGLQLAGYAVLRFTNGQVMSDVAVVVSQIEKFISGRHGGEENAA